MPSSPARTGQVSHWYHDLGGLPARRPPLDGDARADVAIVGAGYTGLWTAWYLLAAQPDLRVVLLERDFAGYGASGRNGGWLTGGFAWAHDRYLPGHGPHALRAFVAAMQGTVDEVIAVADAQGIDADIHRTDELTVATSPAQLARMRAEIAQRSAWGEGDRLSEIGAAEVAARVAIPGALGAMRLTGVARIQPAKLVRGLADAVERHGARICEGTTVTAIAPGRAVTDHGTVTAPIVIRATEGFTATFPGHRRDLMPLNSAQIVTAPLPAHIWAKIGWQGAEILGDFANAYCYCQRTRDGRIAVGGRGLPYRFASGIDRDGQPDPETIRQLTAILRRHFPAAADAPIDHAWCGTLGVPRDWCATVQFDRATGLGWAGGYVGVGVATSNLAGRTLADLALGRDTPLVRLPWINRPLRRWEPEPLRWLAVRGMYRLLHAADRQEAATGGATGWRGRLAHRLTGR